MRWIGSLLIWIGLEVPLDIPSPTILPRAAPILNEGTKTPVGTGSVAAKMDNQKVVKM